ncbi:phosphatase PAP2 family protein [Nitratifractor sp.]
MIFAVVSFLLWGGQAQALDSQVSEFVKQYHQALVNTVVIFLTYLNSPPALLVITLIVAATLAAQKAWRSILVFLGGLWGTALATSLIKSLVQRPRPMDRLVEIHSPSFPSWHASTSMALGILLFWLLFGRWGTKAAWLLLWPLAIGLSRIWLNAHWCSDVLAGWGLGAFVAAGIVLLFGTPATGMSEE